MTVADVKTRLEKIKTSAKDYERAHGLEDKLYYDVLQAIADGNCEDPKACAALAITANEIEFARYGA